MANNKFDKSDFVERLQQLLSFLDEKPTPFAEKIGISRAFMNDVFHLRSGPSVQMLYGITNFRSDINLNWLLTGRGRMLLKGEDESEEKRVLAESLKKDYHLLETSVKTTYQQLVDSVGEEQAERIIKEVMPVQQGSVMIPLPVRAEVTPSKVDRKRRK